MGRVKLRYDVGQGSMHRDVDAIDVEDRERQPSETDVPWPSRGFNCTVTSGSAPRHKANLVSPHRLQYPDFGIVPRSPESYVMSDHVNGPVIPTVGMHRHIQGITSRVQVVRVDNSHISGRCFPSESLFARLSALVLIKLLIVFAIQSSRRDVKGCLNSGTPSLCFYQILRRGTDSILPRSCYAA